jgi:hypothetical protein
MRGPKAPRAAIAAKLSLMSSYTSPPISSIGGHASALEILIRVIVRQ